MGSNKLSFDLDDLGLTSAPSPIHSSTVNELMAQDERVKQYRNRKKIEIWEDYYKANLDYRIANNSLHPQSMMYCPVCKWTTTPTYKYCAYGHGELADLSTYEGILLEGI